MKHFYTTDKRQKFQIQFKFLTNSFQTMQSSAEHDHDLSFFDKWANRKIKSNRQNSIEKSSDKKILKK